MTVNTRTPRHRSDSKTATPLRDITDTFSFEGLNKRSLAAASVTGIALTATVAGSAAAAPLPSTLPSAPSGDFVSNLQATESATLVSLDVEWEPGDTVAATAAEPAPEVVEAVAEDTVSRDYDRTGDVAESYAPAPQASASGVVATALQYVGYPYVYGAAGPNAFDCSGFTQYIFALHGISLPRTSYDQAGAGTIVSAADAQPGDLVILNGGGHVAIYMGDGMIVHASTPSTGVKVSGLYGSYYFVRV